MIREGRLGKSFDEEVSAKTSSLEFDIELFRYDLLTDMAHIVMLVDTGIIEKEDAKKLLQVLKKIEKKGIQSLDISPELEDIHMAIESQIIKEIGDTGGRLQTARSRNDQVACDLRMKTREDVNLLIKSIIGLIIALLEVAEKNTLTLIPAFTHLQHAQPTTLAHHLISYVDSLIRNITRLEDAYDRIDLCPLGAGAVTTTSYPIDRNQTSSLLGFEKVLENSMDAVSSRDYLVEVGSIASLISIDISRISEELILWSTKEFSFIEISSSFASTSSIMPQKKNPDVIEIVRARTASVFGSLVSILTMQRSLPQSYNRDLQELSPIFFRIINTTTTSLSLISRVVNTMQINEDIMNAGTLLDFSTATELADILVKEKKIPFRTAHQIVGKAVTTAIKEDRSPEEFSSEFMDRISTSVTGDKLGLSDEKVTSAMTPLLAVKARKVLGGPAPEQIKKAIHKRFDEIVEKEKNLAKREGKLSSSIKVLLDRVDSILEG
jgi:argininosuccinate lyase